MLESQFSFLTIADCQPNLNTYTGAGKVSKIEPLTGKTPGLALIIDYKKVWPAGHADIWPIRCYVSGAERVERLKWMKVHDKVVVRGEVTNRNTIYAHVVGPWSPPPKDEFDEDEFPMPAGTQQTTKR
jgi:hypothetical protein